ncbi:MAG: nucleoside kinase [Bacteroidales bacterium]|nr:nucleoside kinase [Bacteroidales bacterium]
MSEKVKIFCENNSQYYEVEVGTPLKAIADLIYGEPDFSGDMHNTPIAAIVDNTFKGLGYEIFYDNSVKFVDYYEPDGRRTYSRTLNFILQKAVSELYPDKVLCCQFNLPNGLYWEICKTSYGESIELWDEDIRKIDSRMREIVAANFPFKRSKKDNDATQQLYNSRGQIEKAKLINSVGGKVVTVHTLDGYTDNFYGPLTISSGYIKSFRIEKYSRGICIVMPSRKDINVFPPMQRQDKILAMFLKHASWCRILGANSIGTINDAIRKGYAHKMINLCEIRQERLFAEIADEILAKKDKCRIVFLAGPSSSGKTSTSKRIAGQCIVNGLVPKVVELDNYFLPRERTPKDENGEYDFESLQALDLELLNKQLNQIIAGEEVELPTFDFKKGEQQFLGNKLKLENNEILIMEGIHALNPEMTPSVDNSRILRIYASELTSLSIDENNNISTIDTRLLRRILRDNRTRGVSPEETILRWPSVRRGENRNIFPFQENADLYFNTALIYELPVMKHYVEPLLRRISPKSAAYAEAKRLLGFLSKIDPISDEEIKAVPPHSIMREFIGGQIL